MIATWVPTSPSRSKALPANRVRLSIIYLTQIGGWGFPLRVAPGFGEYRRTGQAHRGGAMCDALGPFSAVMGSFVLPLTAVTLLVLAYRHARAGRSADQR